MGQATAKSDNEKGQSHLRSPAVRSAIDVRTVTAEVVVTAQLCVVRGTERGHWPLPTTGLTGHRLPPLSISLGQSQSSSIPLNTQPLLMLSRPIDSHLLYSLLSFLVHYLSPSRFFCLVLQCLDTLCDTFIFASFFSFSFFLSFCASNYIFKIILLHTYTLF